MKSPKHIKKKKVKQLQKQILQFPITSITERKKNQNVLL